MRWVGGAEVDAGVVLYSNTVERRTFARERPQEVAVHTLSTVTWAIVS